MQAVRLETCSEKTDVFPLWRPLLHGARLGVLCLQDFKESCQKFYQAELEELSFAKDTEECRKHINDWVAEKTEGERFHFSGLGKLGRNRR